MAVYTRFGDEGFTRLVGGARVKKNHPRVEAYGAIDTLNAQAGFTVSLLDKDEPLRKELQQLQQWIFNCSSDVAAPAGKRASKLADSSVKWLEEKIDAYEKQLPEIRHFIICGGTQLAASLHLCRCFTREAERRAVALQESGDAIHPQVLIFLNRLSDYFFVVARWMNVKQGGPEIFYQDSPKVFSKKRGPHVSSHAESKE